MSGFDVIQAANGADAIAHSSSHVPDVVLMDLSLPVIDGWEATRRLKSDERTAHIPVVALTAHDGAGELQRATQAGCDWFVPKPCPPDALITEVRRVLTGSRDPAELRRNPHLTSLSPPETPGLLRVIASYAHANGVTGAQHFRVERAARPGAAQ